MKVEGEEIDALFSTVSSSLNRSYMCSQKGRAGKGGGMKKTRLNVRLFTNDGGGSALGCCCFSPQSRHSSCHR